MDFRLPAEGILGAIVGAILGTIIATHPYFKVNGWLDTYLAFFYVVIVIGFGCAVHFYTTALMRGVESARRWGLLGCIILLVAIGGNPKELSMDQFNAIRILPHEVNILLAASLLVWLLVIRAMVYLESRIGR